MSPENPTESEQPLAIVLVEAQPGSGRIVIPGAKKTISLADYQQTENVTIPEHVVVHKEKTIRMGRDASNELILDIANVSRFHAILTSSTSSLRVSDLSSTNGTFVNGNPVTAPVKLETGDVIDVGPAKLKIELLSDIGLQNQFAAGGNAVRSNHHFLHRDRSGGRYRGVYQTQ